CEQGDEVGPCIAGRGHLVEQIGEHPEALVEDLSYEPGLVAEELVQRPGRCAGGGRHMPCPECRRSLLLQHGDGALEQQLSKFPGSELRPPHGEEGSSIGTKFQYIVSKLGWCGAAPMSRDSDQSPDGLVD